MNNIQNRLENVLASIRKAEFSSGRQTGSVKLLAVSKFHPSESVLQAVSCGQLLFGENRVQEAMSKFQSVKENCSFVKLHIIGQLQRNKVKQAISIADCIQSVDRIELLQEIEKQAEKQEKVVEVLFEFHTAEESKSGYTDIDSLFRSLEYVQSSKYIVPAGFMTMAPFSNNDVLVSESFKKLVSVQHKAQSRFPEFNLDELSMGMSNDYTLAIAEGATMVRIGAAIFGERV